MKHSHIFLSALIGMSMPAIAKAEIVDISTPKTSLILDAEKGGGLRLLHYGNRMESTDIATLKDAVRYQP